jgi:hypothetical protein
MEPWKTSIAGEKAEEMRLLRMTDMETSSNVFCRILNSGRGVITPRTFQMMLRSTVSYSDLISKNERTGGCLKSS